jgi:hypothetical protein
MVYVVRTAPAPARGARHRRAAAPACGAASSTRSRRRWGTIWVPLPVASEFGLFSALYDALSHGWGRRRMSGSLLSSTASPRTGSAGSASSIMPPNRHPPQDDALAVAARPARAAYMRGYLSRPRTEDGGDGGPFAEGPVHEVGIGHPSGGRHDPRPGSQG